MDVAQRTHWSMGVTGGAAFVLRFAVFRAWGKGAVIKVPYWGVAYHIPGIHQRGYRNVRLKLNVWDYSQKRYQLYGQVCLTYSFYGARCACLLRCSWRHPCRLG
jgi:hypothetical protein